MSELKPYLVDVPVRVNIWIREECQRKQFEVLKEARPSIMFLISDGGRNEKEWKAIKNNRAIFENEIDWECTVYKIYEDKNNGLYTMSKKGADLVWSIVDRCIFLEDDQVVSVSYFKFCEELLEKYKDDMRICGICAMNNLEEWKYTDKDYFFAKTFAIWGMATWKRTYNARNKDFSYSKDPYIMNLLMKEAKKDKIFKDSAISFAKIGTYNGHVAGGEFFNALDCYGKNQMFIIPKRNMMRNIGNTENATHADKCQLLPKADRKCFDMNTYEIDFPIKHQEYVINDEDYIEKVRKAIGNGYPIISLFRKIERMFLILKYKGIKGIFKAIKKKAKRKNQIEN